MHEHTMPDALAPAGAPFSTLTPDRVLDCVEARGLVSSGRLLALNSYENRVYRVGLEDGSAVIAKFYRAARWSDAAILEEHAFARELADAEIPVVPPLAFDGVTLHHDGDVRYTLFPNRPGRTPELDRDDTLRWVGRFLGRIHARGATAKFRHRQRLTVEHFGRASATSATSCGPRLARISSISTTACRGRLCRTCGCCCPATPTSAPISSASCSRATRISSTSIAAKSR
jgi:Ser/Thr protein kinase RdoA (MazF antagonist)